MDLAMLELGPAKPEQPVALDEWESEGGRVAPTPRAPEELRHTRCVPALPAGYVAQVAWGFRDETGALYYEFDRVYGPGDGTVARGGAGRLDEDLSYWCVTWQTASEPGQERVAGRWLTYAEACEVWDAPLTFDRYSSLLHMRHELAGLLHVQDIFPSV